MVRKLIVPFSMVVLILAAVLMTGCGEGSDRIVSPGQTDADQYNFLDGIDPYNPGQYGDQTFDSLASGDVADDEIDISAGEEDEPPADDDPSFKDLEERNNER